MSLHIYVSFLFPVFVVVVLLHRFFLMGYDTDRAILQKCPQLLKPYVFLGSIVIKYP